VRDLDRSKAFFSRLGFGFNAQFTDEKAACMIVEENIKTFTSKPVADAKKSTEVLVCLSCESKEEIDGLVAKASANGGKAPREAQDHGFMYQHAFEDPDGHLWELVHMRSQP
jgi:predicted lactoylglutathione lyase